ncbi:MAG TPA: cytochrome c peroxidase [Pyrinomonadaceae bacterium]|nr:cytochrome c peroxidase [Pyrinomonadaceae bacterium]
MRTLRLLVVCPFVASALLVLSLRLLPGSVSSGQTSPTLYAPAGVVASDNSYSTKVGVTWEAVRGATSYRILRNTTNDPGTAVSLGTTPANSFFDATAAQGQTFFYWVRAENGSNVGPVSQPDQGTRAGVVAPPGVVPPLNPPPVPAGNQVTAAKAALGKTLFWDEQLSSTRTVSCGTCHFSANGGSDSRTIVNSARARNPGADNLFNTADDVFASPGVPSNNASGTYSFSNVYGFREQVTGRKARSYIDAGYSNTLFWDGRAGATFIDPLSNQVVLQNGAALESQVLAPPVSASEMAHAGRDWNDVAARVAASKPLALSPEVPAALEEWIGGRGYPELFAEAFGTADVTPARIALAVATFERTLYSDRTPFDAAVSGIAPLPPAEARGQGVFNGPGRCNTCHAGTLFTDNQFHNVGLRPQAEDPGRFAVTGNANDLGEFRTPSLRNVGLRAPYFHNGRFATLEEVVDFYNRGGDFDAPNIDRNRIRPLGLSAQQRTDLVAFLRGALTDPRVAAGQAPFDRPMLYTESSRVPQLTGAGTPGSGGSVPVLTAIEPPLVGNPSFTVAVSNALGGAQAVLVVDGSDPGAGPSVPPTGSFARVGVQLSGSGAGAGFGSVSLQIPDSAALVGQTFFGRWFVTDPGAAGGVSVTPAFKMTVFGEATTTPASNQIDLTQFFVAQQYRDFLSREPDAAGQSFWEGNVNECGASAQCVEVKRVNVSAAFFLSIEFQQTGFYAIRVQRAAFGRRSADASRISFASFLPDARALGQSVVVGQGDWQGQLDANKQAYAERVAAGADFVARFPASQSAAEYVNALYASAGVQPSQAEVDDAVIAFGSGGTQGRGAALRRVAESASLTRAEFNPSFVLMEYFGYLRRDPDEAGYQFWLSKLNQFGGDFVEAEMVKAFLSSDEYRARFTTP